MQWSHFSPAKIYPISSRERIGCLLGQTFSVSLTNKPTISDVHPNTRRQNATTTEPTTMNGLRRPHFDLDRSAMTPIKGWIISPDNGPAIHTNEVLDFVRPSCRRYGVQSDQRPKDNASVSSQNIDTQLNQGKVLTGHLCTPSKSIKRIGAQSATNSLYRDRTRSFVGFN